jgi:hypothetical protein
VREVVDHAPLPWYCVPLAAQADAQRNFLTYQEFHLRQLLLALVALAPQQAMKMLMEVMVGHPLGLMEQTLLQEMVGKVGTTLALGRVMAEPQQAEISMCKESRDR